MADLCRCYLMGRLTADPELKPIGNDNSVTELRMAINRSWSDKSGDKKEETLFIDCTVWGRQAENCCKYLKKGSSVHVEGSLKMDSWVDKNTGEKRSKIKVTADRVQFLDKKSSESEYVPPEESPAHSPARGMKSFPKPQTPSKPQPAPTYRKPEPDTEDPSSIPF